MSAKKGKASWTSIWSAYRYRARMKGFEWLLTRAEFDNIIHRPCHYCGESPELADGNTVTIKGVRLHYSGVDRRNNEPRYALDNTVPCCAKCNIGKGIQTEEGYLEHVKKIHAFRFANRGC